MNNNYIKTFLILALILIHFGLFSQENSSKDKNQFIRLLEKMSKNVPEDITGFRVDMNTWHGKKNTNSSYYNLYVSTQNMIIKNQVIEVYSDNENMIFVDHNSELKLLFASNDFGSIMVKTPEDELKSIQMILDTCNLLSVNKIDRYKYEIVFSNSRSDNEEFRLKKIILTADKSLVFFNRIEFFYYNKNKDRFYQNTEYSTMYVNEEVLSIFERDVLSTYVLGGSVGRIRYPDYELIDKRNKQEN